MNHTELFRLALAIVALVLGVSGQPAQAQTDTDSFITTWSVPAGNDAARTITFPGSGTYDINWGDSTPTETSVTGTQTHAYAAAGDYDISVANTITRFNLNNGADKEKLTDIKQWGRAQWSSMERAFQGAANMQMSATDLPDLSEVRSIGSMFANATVFNGNIGRWNVSAVTDMTGMFFGASAFNRDISGWNVSAATDMGAMFANATAFSQNLGRWYIVTSPIDTYDGATNFEVLTIAAQNAFLNGQNPQYALVSGDGADDNDKFTLSGTTLSANAGTPGGTYNVRIGASGGSFGTGNAIAADVTVTAALALDAVADQSYTMSTAITDLILPAATGGTAPLTYTLTPDVPGLTFDAGTRTLSGTPTTAATTTLTYTVTDSATPPVVVTQTFTVTVADPTVTVADPNAGLADLNTVILPEMARAIAGQTVSAITQRIDQARSGGGSRSITIAGQSTLAGAASAHGQAITDGTLSLKDVLGNSDFVLPLADDGANTGNRMLSSLALWGGGDYRSFEGSGGSVNFDGDLFSTHLGLDTQLRDDLLIGLAGSWSQSDLDYKGNLDLSGNHKLDLTSVHPYVSLEALAGQLDLWATGGYGWGGLEITDDGQGRASSDVEAWNVAVGGNYQLLQRGPARFRLKSSALLTEMEVEGSDDIEALEVESSLLRMILEGAYKHTLADGTYVEPSLEAGVRYDGGDGETGFGAELGAGFRYTDPIAGLTLEGRARTLVGRDNYEEWGISGLILLEQGSNGRGLSFSLSPGYGDTGSGTEKVWQQGLFDEVDSDRGHSARMDARLGYGLTAPGGRGTADSLQ